MRWLARASPRGLDDSIGFGAAGLGPVPGRPVSALVFGTRPASSRGSMPNCPEARDIIKQARWPVEIEGKLLAERKK